MKPTAHTLVYYIYNGEYLTARQIAKILGQTHTQTRRLLYAGRSPKIETKTITTPRNARK